MNEIDYRIVRSKRKTALIEIDRNGSVIVRAPFGVTDEAVKSFVQRHKLWIEKRLAEQKRFALDLTDGKVVRLFGTEYTVLTGKARIDGQILYLPQDGREKAFTSFLRGFSAEIMGMLTNCIANKCHLSYHSVRISSARGRWGSCNRNADISYSFRVAFLSPELCEYLVVHELCHTLQLNHGRMFWLEVERIMPDWKERRKQLKSQSAVMGVL